MMKSCEDKVLVISSVLLVLTLISIFFLGKELIKRTNEANKNPDSYEIVVSIKNNVVQDTIILVKNNNEKYIYTGKNKKEKKEYYNKITNFMTNSLTQLTQEKKVPDSFSEIISGWKGKPVTVRVKWKNTKKVYRSELLSGGDVTLYNSYEDEEIIDTGRFEKTFSNSK